MSALVSSWSVHRDVLVAREAEGAELPRDQRGQRAICIKDDDIEVLLALPGRRSGEVDPRGVVVADVEPCLIGGRRVCGICIWRVGGAFSVCRGLGGGGRGFVG